MTAAGRITDAMPTDPAGAPAAAGWKTGWAATLDLGFTHVDGLTRLTTNRHVGPLRLIKALRGADGRTLEAVIVHPPGGLVGGDSLGIALQAGAGCRVLATTPGAQKWYRSERTATAETAIVLAGDGRLDWLPQPAILFDRSRVVQRLSLDLAAQATCIGWEILIRGRAAMGETWREGRIDQTLAITVDGTLRWRERLQAGAGDRLFDSPLGWAGRSVAASVWCCAPAVPGARLIAARDAWCEALEAAGAARTGSDAAEEAANGAANGAVPAPAPVLGGASVATTGLLLAKVLGDDSETVLAVCQRLWRLARTVLDGEPGPDPRIWTT